VVLHLIFAVARMVFLWRKGRREEGRWGLVALAIIPVGAYFLWAGYFLALIVVSGPKGDPL